MHEDRDLRPSDIQALSNKDGLAAFWGSLGYSIDARLAQTPQAMGITGDSLQRQIRHIERIADQENGTLQVYLVELRSVTQANLQGIARAFRNRVGQFLLVFTSDYEDLDFVLLERVLPGTAEQGIGTRQVSIRPRTLTVNRRNPGPVELRVLRRFTFTEGDADAQYDKLLSAYTVAEWSERFFNNRALFSDYYLNERLRSLPEWSEDPKPTYKRLRELYAGSPAKFTGKPESPLRRELFEPVLTALGFEARRAESSSSDEVEPDYRLFASGAKANGKPLAVCLAYVWSRLLDGKDETRDSETPEENPSFAVVSLLESAEAPWAIVTNGKVWRLYSAKAHSRATNYYEIDLEEALASSDPNEFFRYFWLLFRAAAFVRQPIPGAGLTQSLNFGAELEPCATAAPVQIEGQAQNLSFLDRLLEGSEAFAKRLGERLKDRVFEDIFPHFAEGFIQGSGGTGRLLALADQQRETELSDCFQATLTFLYRLLFLLYAESRDLLPVRETRGYHEASLTKLKEEVAIAAGTLEDQVRKGVEKAYRNDSTALYDRIFELCRVLDNGNQELNVPLYNGGLFLTTVPEDDASEEAKQARFLARHKLPDRFLALGLDLMARDEDEKRRDLVFIDYKSLGVRQLGSIYEGLLEFKLRVANEKMAVIKGKKTEEVVPYSEAKRDKLKILTKGRGKDAEEKTYSKGTVYLENDRRERKATGSYYTPDYIVKYIVENTVGPVLEEKFEALRPKLREAQKTLAREREKAAALRKAQGKSDDPEREAYLKTRAVVDELFNVKVLDPAMGSGHFLVEAVDFITDRMLRFLNAFPWNPIQYELSETRRRILDAIEDQGIIIDRGRLTDVNLLKRHVLKRCIYGVDLNPMAVELAKVSLWLDCFTLGAPLSFLDHHLKPGNSLMGVTVHEVQEAVEPVTKITGKVKVAASPTEWGTREVRADQFALFASRFAGLLLATDLMRHVGKLSDVTASQVRESRQEYRKAREALTPFKRILDVYTSQWFGNGSSEGKGRKVHETRAVIFLKSPQAQALITAKDDDALKAAIRNLPQDFCEIAGRGIKAAAEKQFFHWELEFPEIFYGPRPGSERLIERLDGAGFDVVIGNPPYDEPSQYYSDTSEADIQFYSQHAPFGGLKNGRLNLYRLFIARALEQVRSDGWLSFIVPLALLGDDFSLPTRRLLLQHYDLHTVDAFPQKDDPTRRVFPEAKLSTCVFTLKKKKACATMSIRTHPGRFFEDHSPHYRTTAGELLETFRRQNCIPTVAHSDWLVLKKVFAKPDWPVLEGVAKIYVGEIFDNAPNKKYLSDRPIGPRVLRGANIDRFLLRAEPTQGQGRYLNEKLFLKDKKRATKLDSLKRERVGLQRGAAVDNWRRLIACIIPAGVYCFDTVLLMVPEKLDKRILIALVNSDLWEWRFRATSTTNHVNEYELAELVVPPCLLDIQSQPYRKTCEFIDRLFKSPAGQVRRSECQQVSEESVDFKIDSLIFQSYGLSESDIEVVRTSIAR